MQPSKKHKEVETKANRLYARFCNAIKLKDSLTEYQLEPFKESETAFREHIGLIYQNCRKGQADIFLKDAALDKHIGDLLVKAEKTVTEIESFYEAI